MSDDVGEELMRRAAQQSLADREGRRRVLVLIDGEDLRVEERVADARAEIEQADWHRTGGGR